VVRRMTRAAGAAEEPCADGSRLLAALPPSERERLLPSTDVVELAGGQALHERGEPIQWLYFPVTAVVSVVSQLADGHLVEVYTVGCEGVVGLPVALGGESTPFRATVEVPGLARRIAARVVREETSRGGPLKTLLDRYAQALLTQTAQWAACNRLHPIDQRCARWLLLTHDQVQADRFPLTHEMLAVKLGARRQSVTTAARMLQQAGLIRYSRGRIAVLDRAGLEAASCACYRVVRAEYDRLLG
jgi:CRP-like cAMP-binding protein